VNIRQDAKHPDEQNGNDLGHALYANNSQSAVGHPMDTCASGRLPDPPRCNEGALQGQWMHVAATYGGGSLKMYVNGMLERRWL